MQTHQAEYHLLDVFTEKKYGGNPLAIFPDASHINENLFQKIARELNLSETVFLFPPKGQENYAMRIFTPGTEMPTAGHPTVGTACYLAGVLPHPQDGLLKITLNQQVGPIDVFVQFENGQPGTVTMHQLLPTFGATHNDKAAKLAALLSLGVDDLEDLPIQEVSCGNNVLIVPVRSISTLQRINFRLDVWEEIKGSVNKAMVYAFTKNGVKGGDVQGRVFGPEVGILEDPATGSANGPLASYLTHHQLVGMPAVSLQGYEMGRPSQLHLDTEVKDGKITAVKVGGKSVFVGKGLHFLELL